jgi:hypothetical protein
MKKNLTALLAGILLSLPAIANDSTDRQEAFKKHQLNFFIISKPKKGKIDLASRFNIVRAGIRSFFHRKKFIALVAGSAEEMIVRVRKRLQKRNALIGTIWFDSHGIYKKGYSVFFIGKDEFNYRNIRDPGHVKAFRILKSFCHKETNVVIGSCYGGATYKRISFYSLDSTSMNGDSLIIGLAEILDQATVYGSEGWVMTKPGLFREGGAVEGFPMRRLFRDIVYRPVWEHVSIWNSYSNGMQHLNQVPPVTLDKFGNLHLRNRTYLSEHKARKKVNRKMKRLAPDLYKD